VLGTYLQQSEPIAGSEEIESDYQWDLKIWFIVAKRGAIAWRFSECLEMYKIQIQKEFT